MEQNEEVLIQALHKAQKLKDSSMYLSVSLKLAEFYYEHKKFEKAQHHLNNLNKEDPTIENVQLYLGLIEIYNNNYSLAKKYLHQEIKNNPHNSYARDILQKITYQTNFPYMTLFFAFLFLVVFILFFPQMSFSQLLLYGVSLENLTIFSAITSVVSHVNLTHLLFNLFLLLFIGSIVERHIGSIQFSVFFLITGLISNISQVLFGSNNTIVLGASGALFGCMGILLMQQPLLKLRLFGIIKVPVILLYGSLFTISILFSTYFMTSAELSHMFGLFAGIFYAGITYNQTISVFYHWVIITFGFYFLMILPKQLLQHFVSKTSNYTLISSSFLFIIGILMIVYSYTQLKRKYEDIGGYQNA